jgi:TRAP-type C4-dicarboxylate transport system permease small subunit
VTQVSDTAPAAMLNSDRWLSKIENLLNNIAALGIFVLMLTATVQILGRKLLNIPIPGYIDIAEQSIALFAFMGAAYCQRLNGHVRMELILSQLRGRLLWFIEAFGILVAMVLVGIMIKYGFEHFLRAWKFGDSTIDIGLAVWPSKLVVPIAFSVLWLRLLLQFIGYCRLVRHPQATPVLVPLIENTKEQAEREARETATADGQSNG